LARASRARSRMSIVRPHFTSPRASTRRRSPGGAPGPTPRRGWPRRQWSHGRNRGDVHADAAGANSGSAAMEPSLPVTTYARIACLERQTTRRSPRNFGTAVYTSEIRNSCMCLLDPANISSSSGVGSPGVSRYTRRRRRIRRPHIHLSAPPPADPPTTQLEWKWAICTQGWAVWLRAVALEALEGARFGRAAIAPHGGRLARNLLVVLAIASVVAHHVIAAALAHIPLSLCTSMEFGQLGRRDELTRKEARYG
jgi:hypothetical protein